MEKVIKKGMELSIIIVSHNTRGLLRGCLDSIYRNTKDLQYEVIVVDNSSGDGSGQMVTDHFPNTRLVQNTSNEGFAKANNDGFQRCQGEHLLFLNSDTIIRNNAAAKLTDYLKKHPTVGVVGPKILTPDGTPTRSYQRFLDVTKLYLGAKRLRHVVDVEKHRMHYPRYQFTSDQEVEWLSGAALAVKRYVFNRIGKWDERYFLYYEDMDLCLQAKRAGYKVVYHPAAEVVHLFGRSEAQARDLGNIRRKSQQYYFKKNYSTVAYSLACIYMAITGLQRRN